MNNLNLPLDRLACSMRTATLSAILSSIAYKEKEQVSLDLNKYGLSLVDFFDSDGIQGFIARNDKIAFLIFRGTNLDIRDFVVDLSISKVTTEKGKVHKGFFEAFIKVKGFIEFNLNEIELPLIISGHSMGGALAIMASCFLSGQIRDRLSSVYTFGAPGVGNSQFENACLELPIYKFVHRQDIVSRVPFFMKKPGDLYFASGEKIIRGNSAYWSYLGNNFLSVFNILMLRYSKKLKLEKIKSIKPMFENHGIQNYVEFLEKHLEQKGQSIFKVEDTVTLVDLNSSTNFSNNVNL